jgi:hypothetical protein
MSSCQEETGGLPSRAPMQVIMQGEKKKKENIMIIK